jgi:hypothetical protein
MEGILFDIEMFASRFTDVSESEAAVEKVRYLPAA